MSEALPELPPHIAKRYEDLRRDCLRWANLHESSKLVCHEALSGLREGPDAYRFAQLLDDMMLAFEPYARQAVLAERERCAKLVEQSPYAPLATPEDWTKRVGDQLAAAIRAVGSNHE
jgi:hypothetical protein